MADSVHPDLALIDYRMPEMDGVSVTESIKTPSLLLQALRSAWECKQKLDRAKP